MLRAASRNSPNRHRSAATSIRTAYCIRIHKQSLSSKSSVFLVSFALRLASFHFSFVCLPPGNPHVYAMNRLMESAVELDVVQVPISAHTDLAASYPILSAMPYPGHSGR